MDNNKSKILFVYQEDDEYKTESVWALRKGDFYVIDNIPFFINNIAYGDLVSVEQDDDELYFDSLLKESGNSTIQLISFKDLTQEELGSKFEKFKCSWEGSHLKDYISINVPKSEDYLKIKSFLEEGSNQGLWDYKEACISNHHKALV